MRNILTLEIAYNCAIIKRTIDALGLHNEWRLQVSNAFLKITENLIRLSDYNWVFSFYSKGNRLSWKINYRRLNGNYFNRVFIIEPNWLWRKVELLRIFNCETQVNWSNLTRRRCLARNFLITYHVHKHLVASKFAV